MTSAVSAAEIYLSSLRHNLEQVRRLVPQQSIMAVTKANAYGHDLSVCMSALDAADALAVARVDEGVAARAAGYNSEIIVLEGMSSVAELSQARMHNLQLVLHDASQLDIVEVNHGEALNCWLKLDTGMNRLGFRPQQFESALQRLKRCPSVAPDPGLMTHLACADSTDNSMSAQQLAIFREITAAVPGVRSIANSAAILAMPEACQGWLRPGLMLYGISPFAGTTAADYDLQPVMRFRSQLISVKPIAKGETVGYGATWEAPCDGFIGVAAVGYGDGYPGNLPSGTPVLVNGRSFSLAGRVSMDMCTIDLGSHAAQVGDEVELWGPGLAVEHIAARCGRIAYELVTGVSRRVPRVAV